MESIFPTFASYRLLFEMLAREPTIDPARVAGIAAFEARWRCRVPASLREWFAFSESTVEGCYPSATLVAYEQAQPEYDLIALLRIGLPRYLYLHRHDGDHWCYVRLDQGDDPPVVFD